MLRQLFDAATGTFTYLLADVASAEGVLIDPVFEEHSRDLSLIQELDIRLVACLDTHVHADHVTGSWLITCCLYCLFISNALIWTNWKALKSSFLTSNALELLPIASYFQNCLYRGSWLRTIF